MHACMERDRKTERVGIKGGKDGKEGGFKILILYSLFEIYSSP